MSRIGAASKRAKDVVDLIQKALYNRSDDSDIFWDDDEIKKTIDEIVKVKNYSVIPGDRLNILCETKYFIVVFNGKDDIIEQNQNKIFEEINRYFKDNETQRNELINLKKIAIMVIAPDLETRTKAEQTLEKQKSKLVAQIKKTIKAKVKIKLEYIYILNQKEKSEAIEITGIDRYSILQEPQLYNEINLTTQETNGQRIETNEQRIGYVTSVSLLELVELYNNVGDKLFDNNVRYGISEQLGVDKAIEGTLENDGEKFWFRNNGVTILVKSNDFTLRYPNKIVFNKNDGISVINGAQTITVTAKYYYGILAQKEQVNSAEEKERYDKIVKSIKKAKVLLRIILVKDSESNNEGNDISVALNRQKPIKVEDIAYTLDYISTLQELVSCDETALGKFGFTLKKRGENVCSNKAMDLVEFSRARLACIDKPVDARNGSASTFLKNVDQSFKMKEIFPELDEEGNEEAKKYFNAVLFAHELSTRYNDAKKRVIISDDDTASKKNTLINNAKWFLIAHLVQCLNNGSSEDFSNFNYTADDVKLVDVINEYFEQAANATDKEITLATFKNKDWYVDMKDKIKMDEVCKFVNKQ